MSAFNPRDLPIHHCIPKIKSLLLDHHDLIVEAPPGAGKTTEIPLALLDACWLQGQKIILLEPRRVAARSAAERMAERLSESSGETVGYRMRLATKVSTKTQIEVVTEGVFSRMLQNNPGLEGVGLVIFDEFHERHIDSDTGLALTRYARSLFRESDYPLKIMVMSATLDGRAVSAYLSDAPIVSSQGRQFPVRIYHRPMEAKLDFLQHVVSCIHLVLAEHQGSVLVFLPGQKEINRVYQSLLGHVPVGTVVRPLYGMMDQEEQRQAIAPMKEGQRKVVLATNIAESSLTIEGVSTVIDTGKVRVAQFDPRLAVTRLSDQAISLASANQRSGRAGRISAGQCYRLWSASQELSLAKNITPEILEADLAPLILQLAAWGLDDLDELDWMTKPKAALCSQAQGLLIKLGLLAFHPQAKLRLTPMGESAAELNMHPRLAKMLLHSIEYGIAEKAAYVAAMLSESLPKALGSPDLTEAYQSLVANHVKQVKPLSQWRKRMVSLASRYQKSLSVLAKHSRHTETVPLAIDEGDQIGVLLALAYPDRIGLLKSSSLYHLSNGRQASCFHDSLWPRDSAIVVADLISNKAQAEDKIIVAAAFSKSHFDDVLSELIEENNQIGWEKGKDKIQSICQLKIGQLVVDTHENQMIPEDQRLDLIKALIQREGIGILPWTPELRLWQARWMCLKSVDGDQSIPDLSDQALLETLDHWLLPYLGKIFRQSDLSKINLKELLINQIDWQLKTLLDQQVPEKIQVPSGSMVTIDYLQNPPVLSVKLQEMFGQKNTPRIANNRILLKVHLLSPAGRPLQMTQDIGSFWLQGYQEVKKEMKGRYPKHPWPDDPLTAVPSKWTKKKMQF